MAIDSEDGFVPICNHTSSSYSLLSGSLCGIITIHDLHRRSSEPNTCPSVCKIRPVTEKHSGVFKLQWYPHDTGMFTSSGADSLLKVWDTNALVVAEQFRFKGRIQTHAVARAKTHCLVAGEPR